MHTDIISVQIIRRVFLIIGLILWVFFGALAVGQVDSRDAVYGTAHPTSKITFAAPTDL
jgi:hypothetical protein